MAKYICKKCGKTILDKPSHKRKFCSRKCMCVLKPDCISCGKKLSLNSCKRCKSCEIKNRWKTGKLNKSIFPPSWLKGTKGLIGPNKGSFKKGQFAGEKHPMWKGGITKLRKPRLTWEYLNLIKYIQERDNYTCQSCGIRGRKLHVHHIKPWCIYPDSRMDENNLKTLCVKCHKQTESYGRNIY